MPLVYATVPVPDARRALARREAHPHEEVRALLRVIQRNAPGPAGEAPSHAQVAALLGISASTLHAYCAPPRRDRARTPRGVPYPVLYALEVLASCPAGTAAALWAGACA